ncbi:MAG: G5 domain-containing protein, partial [Finegoldia magna]|nr:G5 domain-containing protein [Finegoldia magna]
MKINKKLLMAALASVVIVSAPQAKTFADTQTDDTQAVTEKLIDDQIAKATKKEEKAESSSLTDSEKVSEKSNEEETANTKEKQNQQESSQLQSEKEINSKNSGFGSQALNHPAQATAVSNVGNEADNSGLEISEGKQPKAQQAGKAATSEPNYTDDEKKIKDYNDSERYKETDLTPGSTIVENEITDEGKEKDGFKFDTLNPSAGSTDKKAYGYEIVIDKKTGQRTYTKIVVSDSGLVPVNVGDKPMMGEGEKLTPDSPDVTYKPDEDGGISGKRQKLYNYEASEETLKHINNKDNSSTVIGMKDNYTAQNPEVKYFGKSFLVTYKVNPWPNENDKLQLMKLNGEYNEKVFVKGQDINTGVKVDNIDANAKDRLVGQVYNPITGAIVPGARAYIGDDGNIHIQMPEGALKKNADGKYVVNEDSIFNTKDYKGLQNLDVKFFARPRTADEFKTIAETPDDNGETGTYVETGAGSADINHKGTNVKIDKQGIDRYDHYNLIGKLKLNLDDTRYYDQDFKDQEGNKIEEHTSTKVFPGQDFSVEIKEPAETGGTKKTGAEMDGAYSRGEASGKLKGEFLDIANKQIADDLGVDYKEFITNDDYADKRWTVVGKSDNISKFTIRAPKQAKAGDFLALPVEYTYTNGSTDTHWFHFVVQETNNNRPEYLAEVGPQGNTLVNKPIITKSEEDLKKNQPESYELIGNTFKDNKGNVWNVSIDQTTGAVTATLPAKLPDGKEINGGEKLTVPVKVKYTDQTTGEEKTEEIKAQFIATKQHKTLTNETTTSPIPFETEVEYDESLPEGYFKETQAGQKGELKITFVQDTLNGKKGIFQQDGTFKEGESKIVVETVKEPTKRIIKIGTKPASTKIEIPFDTEYEVDNNLEAGKTELVNDGEKGEVTITTTRNEDGTITVNKNVTKEAKNKKIKIGTKTQGQIVDTDKIPFGYKVEFDPDFYKNYPDATENYKIVTPGKEGENTKTWTIVNSEKVGDPKIDKTEPVDAVIKVGQKDYTGTVTNTVTKEVPYKVIIKENPELEAGKSNVKQKGVAGSKTFEYSGEIFNGELKEGTQFTEKEVADKYVAPQEEIIEIGTKPANNEKTYEREVGVEVEYVYDNTKPKGYRNIEALVPGKVITKVVNEYNPKTGEIETTEKIEVIPGKRKVTFGTKDFTGEYEEVVKNINPYKTEIVFDNTLKAGEKVIDQPGKNGETVTKTKKHLVNGVVESSDDPVSEQTKKVKNQIIRVGTMTDGKHSYTEKLPFKTTVEKVSDLKKGEWRYKLVNGEEQKGKVGSRKTEWTIKNSVVTDTNVVSEEKPVDAIIEIGDEDFTGNVSHEVTEEIPYDVKVIEDPNMIAGTSEVVTKGKAGSKTTKYTQAVKNGEADGELKSEVTAQTNPTQQVIKVGTKPAENKKDYAQDVDVKVEYVYDENIDKGVVKVGELTKGKVETKIVNKYDPKTGEVTTTEVEEVKEATQKIIVGTKDFTGTYKYEKTCPLPFEVIIKEDPTLAKGEKVVDQEGQAGSKTTYYEQDIKNGQPDGDPKQLNEKINSQPKNHIVRIGTKVAESSTVKTVDREIPFKTEYIYDENLDAGSQVVDKEGVVGKEKVTITTKITDGTGKVSEETTTITEKEDRKVRIGTKPVTKVVEKPFNTEYQYDENLESGKTEEVKPGKNGKVTITTTYDKDQKKVVTSETEEAGQNRVVKIGGKTNGTEKVKEEIPFEVEVRKDPSLKKGEWKYATDDKGNELKGEKGEQEKTLTIVNSKVTNTSEPTVTKKAKNAVILVGEGTNDGTHEIKEKKELPFETRYEYDENLEAGQREETGGTPGEQERTNTLVIKDGKVEETKEGEFKTTKKPVDKVIKIGIKPIVKEVEKPFETEYIYDENVEMGKEEEVKPGKNGKVTITTSYDKGQKKLVTKEETKDPVKRVVKVGIKPVVEEQPIPQSKNYTHNPNLKDGEIVEKSKGTPGKVIITTTFNKETGKIETKVERTEPTDAEYEYGSKTEGKVIVKSDLPFEVEIIKDPEMEAGKTETVQEGKLGKKETIITVENSKEVSREEKVITEPVKNIVKVGTKNVCPIPPVKPEDPTKPGEKDPENPTKPGEKDPEDPTKPGEKDPEDPTKPGEKDPEDPTKPGEKDPEDPTKPGEKDPENPTKPGEKDPENPTKPGEKDPEDPTKPGEKDPE